ncbi:hypothetical protein [Leptospira inadai]|uniref:hypothetical protein n=1 Tax=Leptospira inadai TaxID=29506 RepID=UPI0011AF2AF8|nr:hypothetical protein [Leptospira inadai]
MGALNSTHIFLQLCQIASLLESKGLSEDDSASKAESIIEEIKTRNRTQIAKFPDLDLNEQSLLQKFTEFVIPLIRDSKDIQNFIPALDAGEKKVSDFLSRTNRVTSS